MARFITKQQHRMSCGATAIANSLKWLGYCAPYRYVIKDLKRAGYNPTKGKYPADMKAMLKAYGIKFKVHNKPTVAKMRSIINSGNAMIFCYDWVNEISNGGHAIFIDFNDFGYFNAYNYKTNKEIGMFSEDYVQQCISMSRYIRRKYKYRGRKSAAVYEIIKE